MNRKAYRWGIGLGAANFFYHAWVMLDRGQVSVPFMDPVSRSAQPLAFYSCVAVFVLLGLLAAFSLWQQWRSRGTSS